MVNRGSNGVILITTKKGSKKKLQVSFNSFTTYNTLAKKNVDVYNGDQFREIINTMAPDKANLLGTSNTNWQDLIFRNTASFDSNLSLMATYLIRFHLD